MTTLTRLELGRRLRSALLFASLLGTCGALAAQEGGTKPDHVSYVNRRGNVATLTGRVTQDSLEAVIVEVDGSERKLDATSVRRVVFGDAPAAFRDGQTYFDRRDYANAAASFRLTASDAGARAPVQAAARQLAARAELLAGAADAAAFARAREEAQRFLLDFPTHRRAPEVRSLEGRAALLAGDSAAAGELYRGVYKELEAGTSGYTPTISLDAGIEAAEAFLAAGQVDDARQLFNAVEATIPNALAELDDDDPARQALGAVQAQARLGDGFCQLASGSVGAAKTFFEGQLRDADDNAALRFGARLGYAQALLAEGSHREARIEFAQVSALDFTDRDRVARALVGLAECAMAIDDTNARSQAEGWVRTVQEQYGDTPAVSKAQELAKLF